MNNLIPNSIEWLKFAKSIGATHWHELKMKFVKVGDGHSCMMFGDSGWEINDSHVCPSRFPESWEHYLIDFSPLNVTPEPDWTAAPEGATKYGRINSPIGWDYVFYNEEKYQYAGHGGLTYTFNKSGAFNINNIEFIESLPTDNQQLTVEPVVKESLTTEWNGAGLPPVGIICYALWDSPSLYYRVKILAHDNGEAIFRWLAGPRAGEFDSSDNRENGGAASGYDIHMKFKIIKSDRERWIEAVNKALAKESCLVSDSILSVIYDAGLAKLPEQPQ